MHVAGGETGCQPHMICMLSKPGVRFCIVISWEFGTHGIAVRDDIQKAFVGRGSTCSRVDLVQHFTHDFRACLGSKLLISL